MPVYKFKLEQDQQIKITGRALTKANLSGVVTWTEWATIETNMDGSISVNIRKGYAWDGCTPKVKFYHNVIGTWDGFTNAETLKPKAYYASLLHDVLCQYVKEHNIPRRLCDYAFYYQLKKDKFLLAPLYFVAVRTFSILKGLFQR